MSAAIESPEETAGNISDSVGNILNAAIMPETRLYLLLDASRSFEIPVMLDALSEDAVCLFDGAAKEDFADTAPWLTPVSVDDDVFDWYMDEGWGRDWGVFLISSQTTGRVKSSLKRSVMVQDEDGQEMFFKFYRPSVLNVYLPVFEFEQASYLMRDVAQFWTEWADDPTAMNCHEIKGGALTSTKVQL